MLGGLARHDACAGKRDKGLIEAQPDLGKIKLVRHCKRLSHQLHKVISRITAHGRPFFNSPLNAQRMNAALVLP